MIITVLICEIQFIICRPNADIRLSIDEIINHLPAALVMDDCHPFHIPVMAVEAVNKQNPRQFSGDPVFTSFHT